MLEGVKQLLKNNIRDKRPILVSGIHRSGSTWVGNMLALNWNLDYYHEPFNVNLKHTNIPFNFLYEEIVEKHNYKDTALIARYLDEFLENKNTNQGFIKNKLGAIYKRKLIKDPLALFSIEWLVKEYDVIPILLIRHPAAAIASFKKKNWTFDFSNFSKQNNLLNTTLLPFKEQIINYTADPPDLIEQIILLWNITHYRINLYKKKYKNWIFIRHEDFSMNAVSQYEKLYKILGIYFSNNIKKTIASSTEAKVETELVRNSIANIKKWKERLTEEEIIRIKIGTAEVYRFFYSERDWE